MNYFTRTERKGSLSILPPSASPFSGAPTGPGQAPLRYSTGFEPLMTTTAPIRAGTNMLPDKIPFPYNDTSLHDDHVTQLTPPSIVFMRPPPSVPPQPYTEETNTEIALTQDTFPDGVIRNNVQSRIPSNRAQLVENYKKSIDVASRYPPGEMRDRITQDAKDKLLHGDPALFSQIVPPQQVPAAAPADPQQMAMYQMLTQAIQSLEAKIGGAQQAAPQQAAAKKLEDAAKPDAAKPDAAKKESPPEKESIRDALNRRTTPPRKTRTSRLPPPPPKEEEAVAAKEDPGYIPDITEYKSSEAFMAEEYPFAKKDDIDPFATLIELYAERSAQLRASGRDEVAAQVGVDELAHINELWELPDKMREYAAVPSDRAKMSLYLIKAYTEIIPRDEWNIYVVRKMLKESTTKSTTFRGIKAYLIKNYFKIM